MSIESQGVKLFWSASTSYSTAQQVGEVRSFNGPTGSANVIDITHLGSTAKEKLIGLRDEGQLSMDVNLNTSDAAQTALRADRASRALRKAAIKLTDASTSTLVFDAYCSGFSITGQVDQQIMANVVLEIAAAVTWTTG